MTNFYHVDLSSCGVVGRIVASVCGRAYGLAGRRGTERGHDFLNGLRHPLATFSRREDLVRQLDKDIAVSGRCAEEVIDTALQLLLANLGVWELYLSGISTVSTSMGPKLSQGLSKVWEERLLPVLLCHDGRFLSRIYGH